MGGAAPEEEGHPHVLQQGTCSSLDLIFWCLSFNPCADSDLPIFGELTHELGINMRILA